MDFSPFLARWAAVGAMLGVDGERWSVLGRELADRHAEPQRHYHGQEHIVAVLAVLDDLTDDADAALTTALAAFFHDAVYEPTATDNEELSAQLAEQRLAEIGLAPELVASVASIVRATATHTSDGSEACDLFLDADLSILGTEPPVYHRYTKAIRAEYSHLEADEFVQGRAAVLQRFLDRHVLFLTEPGRARFEEQARANLGAEIASLHSGL